MRIGRLHFLTTDEEHSAVVLEAIRAAPNPPAPRNPSSTPTLNRGDRSLPPTKGKITLTQLSLAQQGPRVLPPSRVRSHPPPRRIWLIARPGPLLAPQPERRPEVASLLPKPPSCY